ncbi:hypothetical protein ACQP1G_16365 [Nocardia sp. CA-107356]|uniref:hypothetical protein n=1 Tax=Nocardia sp. CA-107356 TaxID=3239972 RepID=UPI003D8DF58A
MTAFFGYMQLSLAADRAPEIAEGFEALARQHGGSVHGRLWHEWRSPVGILWEFVTAADDELAGKLMPLLRAIADRSRINLSYLLSGPPPAAALLSLLDALARFEHSHADGDRGYLFVPAVTHFDNLGVPRDLVLQLIMDTAPSVLVMFTDPTKPEVAARTRVRLSECRPDSGRTGLLVDVTVSAFADAESVVRANTHWQLPRAGLSELLERVDELMHELIGAATSEITADSSMLTIQMLRPPGADALVVEVRETREHAESVSGAVIEIVDADNGGTVERCRGAVGGTVTRCELPLPGCEQDGLAGTVQLVNTLHRYVTSSRRTL